MKKIFSVFSPTERRTFFAAATLAAVSAVSLGALLLQQATVVVPARGGSYTEGIIGQPMYVNPILAKSEADKALVRLLFSTLEAAADKITPSQNSSVWNIRLKERLFWSDGEKLTSDDVIFTVQKIQDPDSHSPLAPSWQGVAVQRVSELEVQFKLGSPYAFFPENLKTLFIAPKHLFAETPISNWWLSKYNLQPIGSGPYVFDSYENKTSAFITSYRLKANDHPVGNAPSITQFGLEFFPNARELTEAFNAGKIDGFGGFEPPDAASLKRSYETYQFTLPSYYAVFFNQNQQLAFQDDRVREALDAAVDRDAIIREALGGKGSAKTGPVPDQFLVPGQTGATGYSPERANRILDAAGWYMSSSTVRQKKAKGTTLDLEFTLAAPQVSFLAETAKLLQQEWQKIGAKVNLAILSPEETADTIKNRGYQAILFGNIMRPAADLFAFWHSSQRFSPGLNLALYQNKRADQLMADIRKTVDDAAREKKLSDLENIIVSDSPAVFLYSPPYLYFARKDLRGLQPGAIGESADHFLGIGAWYLKTARVIK